METLSEATAAALGGFISALLLYPMEITKNRLQAMNERTSIAAVIADIYHTKGLRGFYDGVEVSVLHSMLEKFGYFYAFALLRQWYFTVTRAKNTSISASLIIGYLSEFAHLSLTIPVERVFVRIQTGKDSGLAGSLRAILSESGIEGLYAGWRTYFVLALKPAIEFGLYEQIKNSLLVSRDASDAVLPTAEAFALGALARGASTLICYPATRAKTMLQSKGQSSAERRKVRFHLGAPLPSEPPTAFSEIRDLVCNRGILALYQGMAPEITRGILSSAIKMAVKERFYLSILRVLVPNHTARSSARR